MGSLKGLAVAPADSRHLQDPAGADQVLADVLRCSFYSQHPNDDATVANIVI